MAATTRLPHKRVARVYGRLRDLVPTLPDEVVEVASQMLGMRSRLMRRPESLGSVPARGARLTLRVRRLMGLEAAK